MKTDDVLARISSLCGCMMIKPLPTFEQAEALRAACLLELWQFRRDAQEPLRAACAAVLMDGLYQSVRDKCGAALVGAAEGRCYSDGEQEIIRQTADALLATPRGSAKEVANYDGT